MKQSPSEAGTTLFDRYDLLADVDARLVTKYAHDNPDTPFREHLRWLWGSSPNDHQKAFYADRFASNPANIASRFKDLVDGIEFAGVPHLPHSTGLIKDKAGYDTPPTPTQVGECANAFAERLNGGVA